MLFGAIKAFIAPRALNLLLYAGIAAGVLAILFGARQSGRNVERVERLQRQMEAARARRDTEVAVRGDDDDAVNDSLRPPSRR